MFTEGGTRVPLIAHWKGKLSAGKTSDRMVHVIDYYPTLLELADSRYVPKGDQAPLHGQSLTPLLNDPKLPLEETQHPTFWAMEATTRGYLDYPWKVVSLNNGPWQLFNLNDDPAESTNLGTTHPERLAQLSGAWQHFAENESRMPPGWLLPIRSKQQGWGWHRLDRIWSLTDSHTNFTSIF